MVSRENLGKAAGWITQPQTMIGNWVGQQVGGWIKNNNERVENKSQIFSANNYKSNLDMPTYNPRYLGFDEANYKKLEQMAVNRGLTGEEKTQFMDEAYQYYYPQVLNEYGLNKRAEEINKAAAENGNAILNGNKEVSWNMKLADLSQTFKRVKGVAYDYPDEQVIDTLKTKIPDGEQLLLNYLNNGDDTILYKAGLKKTDAQVKLDEYNKRKENINKALQQNWKQLSDDGVKYLRNYNVLFQTVDEARLQGMGQGMTDDELLLNLLYISPELQQIEKELGTLNLDHGDKAILGIEDDSKRAIRPERHETVNIVRDWLGWNGDNPATIDDLTKELYVRENMDGQTWKNAKANWRNWGDSLAKFGYRVPRDINNLSLEAELQSNDNLSQEDIDRIREKIGLNKQEVQAFNEATDREQQSYKNQIGLDPIIENYYNNQGVIESLFNNNLGGAWYKGVGEAAGNIDMLAGIPASIINPAFGLFIMGTDTFARENQEAFETLINAQTKQGVSYEDAYNNAVKGAIVVGSINTAIELGLEKFLGGVETTTANNIKQMATKNLNKEVNEMLVKRGILEMLGQGLETQARSSLEEGMEEVLQQLVQNIAESGYDPDKQISEGLWSAFESGALNPMNLLAGGSEMLSTPVMSDIDKQKFMERANSTQIGNGQVIGAYNPKNIIENIKNGNINWNSGIKNETLTRVIPEKVVEGGMKLTPTERARVEQTGISPANFILSEGIAGLDSQDKISQLANIGAEGYNNVTKIFKEVIPDTEVIESKEAQKMLNIMAKVIESSDILSEEYADYLQSIKRLAKQTKFDPYTALAIKRDFDALAGHDLYNSKGQVMKDIEKETIAGWRANLNEKLNKLGEKYGVDVRKENQRVMNAITIRDGLLRAMSQNKKNNFLGLGDLGFGALLSSGNPVQAVAMIGLKKFAQNNIGNIAQYLYNLNNNPLSPIEKKGAGFIKKGDNNAGNLSLSSIMNNPTTVDNAQQGVDAGDLGNVPLDSIPDRDVGANPTDTVISENVNKTAGNQAQELYNEGDKNLSPNSEQMETTKKTTKKKTTKKGKKGGVKWYADEAYRPEIVMTEDEINKFEEKNGNIKQQGGDDIMRTQDIDKLIKIAIAVDETRGNKLKKRLKGLDLVPKERVNNELFKAFGDTETLLGIVIDNYNNGEWEMELPIRESGKRPRAKRPEAGNDVEFNLTDELPQVHRANDIEYITQDGDWLGTRGVDDETLIKIAYPDTFESYDTESLSDRQNGRMDLMADSGMMKVHYDEAGYVYIDLMYEPTDIQIESLKDIGENEFVKQVQLSIFDPREKRIVRTNNLDNMAETIRYINEYFGNNKNSDTVDMTTSNKEELELYRPLAEEEVRWIGDKIRGYYGLQVAERFNRMDIQNGEDVLSFLETLDTTEDEMNEFLKVIGYKVEDNKNNNKTKQYADNAYRPSITMKVDEYETTPTKKVYYDSSEALTNGIGEGYSGPHGYGYYTNTEENEVLRNIHDNGGKDYKGFVYEIEIPEETDKNTPTRSNYFDENYEWSKTDVDNLLKSIEKIDGNLWDKAMDTVLSNLSKYEKIPGHQIYNILSQISMGNKNASELLNKIGYDGIKYNNSFGNQYVVFDKDNVNIGRNYGYNEDRFVRSKGGTQKIQEGYITSKPTEVKYIDKDGNWLSEQHNKDENNLIKVNYHPDGYLNVKLSKDMSSDEMIGFEEFKDHPVKEVEYTIVDDQTGRPITSNRVNTIDEFLEEVEDYFEERGVDGKAYAAESYKPSITMKVDEINKFEENDTKETTKKNATEQAEKYWREKEGWKRDDNEGKWWRYEKRKFYDEKGKYGTPKRWVELVQSTKEWRTEAEHKKWVKEHTKMKIAFDKADSKNDNATKRYADNSYNPEIVMTEDEINKYEERKEVNIRDVIREAGAPKKGVSIEKQLKALDNVESVEEIKKDLIFEQYSEKDLKNELKLVKKYYKEAVKNWEEEGGYYYRDRAAYFLNKIDAIEEMLKG